MHKRQSYTRTQWWSHQATPSCLDDGAEVGAPRGPGAIIDNVGRVGVEWSVVCVELARLVRRTVVVRVTDRWQRAVDHTLQTTTHLDSARHFVDHLLSTTTGPVSLCMKVGKSLRYSDTSDELRRQKGVTVRRTVKKYRWSSIRFFFHSISK